MEVRQVNTEDDNENVNMNEEEEGGVELNETESSENNIETLTSQKDNLQRKYDDLYDRFVRLAADFDNFKKRTSKEKSDVQNYGNEELIKGLLNILDNLERAIDHAKDSDGVKALVDGVQLVYDQFINCLEKFNVKVVESGEGVQFNPKFHEAIERVDSTKYESGIIISEMVKGYTLNNRLIRPSMVSVSKGIVEKDNTEVAEEKIEDRKIEITSEINEVDNDVETLEFSELEADSDISEIEDIIDLTEETNN